MNGYIGRMTTFASWPNPNTFTWTDEYGKHFCVCVFLALFCVHAWLLTCQKRRLSFFRHSPRAAPFFCSYPRLLFVSSQNRKTRIAPVQSSTNHSNQLQKREANVPIRPWKQLAKRKTKYLHLTKMNQTPTRTSMIHRPLSYKQKQKTTVEMPPLRRRKTADADKDDEDNSSAKRTSSRPKPKTVGMLSVASKKENLYRRIDTSSWQSKLGRMSSILRMGKLYSQVMCRPHPSFLLSHSRKPPSANMKNKTTKTQTFSRTQMERQLQRKK